MDRPSEHANPTCRIGLLLVGQPNNYVYSAYLRYLIRGALCASLRDVKINVVMNEYVCKTKNSELKQSPVAGPVPTHTPRPAKCSGRHLTDDVNVLLLHP